MGIRQNEPGYPGLPGYDEYEGINSNVDLIKFEESNGHLTKEPERDRRGSVALNCSITDNVNGGFDVNINEREEKQGNAISSLTFDVKADKARKTVQYVDEDSDHDLFENMNVTESTSEVVDEQSNQEVKGETLTKALKDVFKVVNMHHANCLNEQAQAKEEEREKDEEEVNDVSAKVTKSKSVDVGATWVNIKKEIEVKKTKR